MDKKKILLAGNPNVGKSSVFNLLTGENQHTGNWIGKTVETKMGEFHYQKRDYEIYDLPGTYSIDCHSREEEVARDSILFSSYDLVVIVLDAVSIERNFNLVFQILEYTPKVLLCVNLMDEAKKQGIEINIEKLEDILHVPVVMTSARKKLGIDGLRKRIEEAVTIYKFSDSFEVSYPLPLENAIHLIEDKLDGFLKKRWIALQILKENNIVLEKIEGCDSLKNKDFLKYISIVIKELEKDGKVEDMISRGYFQTENEISSQIVKRNFDKTLKFRTKVDRLLTNKVTGIPIMFLLVMLIFFITIVFANYPSDLLFQFFGMMEEHLFSLFHFLKIPDFITLPLINGVYKTLTWVVSVMLPPMAIFFPLFSLLEDLGYLPRIAFNLDGLFSSSGSCGKQSLTMMMGFGCNAVGVTNARIIDSKRERLIAILTNNFVPCNGRFPMIISIITMFLATNSIIKSSYLFLFILLSFLITLVVSFLLSKTILKGEKSSFTLELPPFRKPSIIKTIIRSFKDKTLKVLKRAIVVSIPAGLIIYLFANVDVGGISILNHINHFLDPLGNLMGLDGIILTAFLLGFPANEIVVPIMIMTYMNTGIMMDLSSIDALKELFVNHGWSVATAISTILFSLFHFPCSTTLITIYKETKSYFWTILSFLLPTIIGIILCIFVRILFFLL